jgi:RimJ/RimL family protein N-acetyltransferase
MTYENQPSVNREILCRGDQVDLCRPLPDDYAFLIQLRNNSLVRDKFCDSSLIEMTKGREWLASRAGRMDDVLLLIRHRTLNQNIGSIGWSDYNTETRSAEFGRLAIDPSLRRSLVRDRELHGVIFHGLALDACTTLRDYVFEELNFLMIQTCYKPDNALAAKVNQGIGMIAIPSHFFNEKDGLIHLALTRQQWLAIKRERR